MSSVTEDVPEGQVAALVDDDAIVLIEYDRVLDDGVVGRNVEAISVMTKFVLKNKKGCFWRKGLLFGVNFGLPRRLRGRRRSNRRWSNHLCYLLRRSAPDSSSCKCC